MNAETGRRWAGGLHFEDLKMRPWAIVIVVFLLICVLAVAAFVGLVWIIGRPPSVANNSILELKIGGDIPEVASQNPFTQLFQPDQVTVYDCWRALDYASRDNRIDGVYLEIAPLGLSMAQIEELRDAIHRFQASDKPVHAFLAVDLVGEKELYLASAADSIAVNPETSFLINGLSAEVTFYKRTLQKLGIQHEAIQFKEFKSAEVYTRDSISQPVHEMLVSILTDLQDRIVSAVAEDRAVDESILQDTIDAGLTSAEEAVANHLVDFAGYRGEVLQNLQKETGAASYRGTPLSDYLKSSETRFAVSSGNKVAFVTGVGVITAGEQDSFDEGIGGVSLAKALREIRKNDLYKAVLLRVDSPGGSPVGSDMVWKEVRELEAAGKPVVVSMSGVAGSGGYYISMGAGKIICQPSTITGSIGVIFGKFDIEGLANWLGMDIERVKISPNADMFSPFTSLSEAQKTKVHDWIEQTYHHFVSKAAEGRGSTYEEFEPKAHGRIYTGAQAVELGLADEVGGYDTAVASLKAALNLKESDSIELDRYPKPKTFWESVFGAELAQAKSRASLPAWLKNQLEELQTAGPHLLMPDVEFR